MTNRQKVALAARLIVGAVLIYAGASKAAGPVEEFAYVISAYDILPKDFVLPAAALMPWIELLVGWALLLGVQTRLAAAASGALFAAFLTTVGGTLLKGIALPNCGCFGDAVHLSPAQAFAMDLVLAGLCWYAYRESENPASLDSWVEAGYNSARGQEANPRR